MTYDQLRAAMKKIGDSIPDGRVCSVIRTLQQCCEAVIEANGLHTRYQLKLLESILRCNLHYIEKRHYIFRRLMKRGLTHRPQKHYIDPSILTDRSGLDIIFENDLPSLKIKKQYFLKELYGIFKCKSV